MIACEGSIGVWGEVGMAVERVAEITAGFWNEPGAVKVSVVVAVSVGVVVASKGEPGGEDCAIAAQVLEKMMIANTAGPSNKASVFGCEILEGK